jgi:ADP-ribose pyrophosphatase
VEPERVVSSRTIYTGHVVTLRVDEVVAEDGHRGEREIIEHRGAVAIVCVHDGDVWFVRQYRHAPEAMLLEIPAGTLREDEDPAVCAARELVEEIGLRPRRLEHLISYYTTPGITNERMHIYFTNDAEPAPVAREPGEVIEIERRPAAELRALIDSGEIADAKSLIGLMLTVLRS